MREIDDKAVRANQDQSDLEVFIKEYESYILHTTHKVTGQYITISDERWSVSLSAFHEAIKSYSYEKGAFLPFAETVIRRRLYDWNRKQSKQKQEILIDSFTAEDSMDEVDLPVKFEVVKKTAVVDDMDGKLEIQGLSSVLAHYGISFFQLAEVSPKAEKTKVYCGKAIGYLIDNPVFITEMKKTKLLPLKIIEKNCKVPRKVLERHRKYIIAGAEILSGDYPILSEYLRFVREVKMK